MPLQNRVQPDGTILAHRARGLFMGNRGILHDDNRRLTHRRWQHKAWVCCLTRFKGRRRVLMTPHRYTELFFHDEAVALAAGHRPCAECRRQDHRAYLSAADHIGPVSEFDKVLHAARATPRRFTLRTHRGLAADLPDGAFFLTQNGPALRWQDAAYPFTPNGYAAPIPMPTGEVTILTPLPSLRALHNGYAPTVALATSAPGCP